MVMYGGPEHDCIDEINEWNSDLKQINPELVTLITREHIEDAILSAPDTAPGPDGIPFWVYKQCLKTSSTIIYNILQDVLNPEIELPEWASECFLFIIPKNADHELMFDDVPVAAYSPSKTRPITVANCWARILSRAALYIWKPIVDDYCHADQRAYLEGRQITDNIEIANQFLQRPDNTRRKHVLLVDFSNAFSSLGHRFIREYCAAAGVPESLIRVLCFPLKTNHTIVFNGKRYPFVSCQAGSRQGDALSGLIFIFILESLLDKLRQIELGNPEADAELRAMVRVLAFADDLAILLERLLKGQFPIIVELFQKFKRASNLKVNVSKTFIVANHNNFSPSELEKFNSTSWGDMTPNCCYVQRYLGLPIGYGGFAHRVWCDRGKNI